MRRVAGKMRGPFNRLRVYARARARACTAIVQLEELLLAQYVGAVDKNCRVNPPRTMGTHGHVSPEVATCPRH